MKIVKKKNQNLQIRCRYMNFEYLLVYDKTVTDKIKLFEESARCKKQHWFSVHLNPLFISSMAIMCFLFLFT